MSSGSSEGQQKWLRVSVLGALLAVVAAWMYVAPPGLMGKLDAIGYAVCHRLDSHSLHIAGLQMPLCARCTGEFNAAAIALIFQAVVSPRRSLLPQPGHHCVAGGVFPGVRPGRIQLLSGVDAKHAARHPGVDPELVQHRQRRRGCSPGAAWDSCSLAFSTPCTIRAYGRHPCAQRALDWRKFTALVGNRADGGSRHPVRKPAGALSRGAIERRRGAGLLGIVFSIVWIMIDAPRQLLFQRPPTVAACRCRADTGARDDRGDRPGSLWRHTHLGRIPRAAVIGD